MFVLEKGIKPFIRVDKFNVLGWPLDMFQNDGFCNKIPDTLAHKDGWKSNRIPKIQ